MPICPGLTGTDLISNILSHFQSMCQTICPHLCLRKYGIHFFNKKVDPNHGEPLLNLNSTSVSTLKIRCKCSASLRTGSGSSTYRSGIRVRLRLNSGPGASVGVKPPRTGRPGKQTKIILMTSSFPDFYFK